MLARSTSRAEPRPSSVKSRGRSWSTSIIPREDSSLARCVARLVCVICYQKSSIVSLAKGARQSAQADQTQHVWPCEVLSTCRKATSLCGGSLVYLFSQRPLSRNEQHEPHAGSFPVRHQSHLQRCAEMLSSQAHVATQSAIRKRVYHLPGFLSLTFDHRAVDAAPAAAFLQTSGQRLENPVELTRSNSIQESRLNSLQLSILMSILPVTGWTPF